MNLNGLIKWIFDNEKKIVFFLQDILRENSDCF